MPISRNNAVRIDDFPGFPASYWGAAGAALFLGDVRACLRTIPTRSVHMCVTSPPYWGLRSYLGEDHPDKVIEIGAEPSPDCGMHGQAQCGACFVCSMVSVFREVRRALRDDGTVWLNLGDTFDNGQGMIPALVALALRADGWRLVQDIIWHSPNKMPESVTSRCTKSHEHIFLLAKGEGYYFDSVAIEEPVKTGGRGGLSNKASSKRLGTGLESDQDYEPTENKNKRDVWIVPTQGYPGAHFATYSPKLITPCILAGTSEHGCCAACGSPYERVVVKTNGATVFHGGTKGTPPGQEPQSDQRNGSNRDRSFDWSRNGKPGTGSTLDGEIAQRETVGWRKTCGCRTDEVVPATVLDPFVGSGTSVATAIQLGRRGVGIDLSEAYLREHAIPRIEAALLGGKTPRKPTVVVLPDVPPMPRCLR